MDEFILLAANIMKSFCPTCCCATCVQSLCTSNKPDSGFCCLLQLFLWELRDGTVVSDGQDFFFRVHCTSLNNHSPLLAFFLCFIVLFQSCCSHAQVFGKTLVHEFPIFYSHTKWNLLSVQVIGS